MTVISKRSEGSALPLVLIKKSAARHNTMPPWCGTAPSARQTCQRLRFRHLALLVHRLKTFSNTQISTGSTSGRPRLKISSISAVHCPMPFTLVSNSMSSASVRSSHSISEGRCPPAILSAISKCRRTSRATVPPYANVPAELLEHGAAREISQHQKSPETRPRMLAAALPVNC